MPEESVRAYVVEPEPGLEVQFCSVLGLPVDKSQRVRTLPGFHLLSLAAGREALARGSYQAFGQKFPCQDLEYLHPEDRVFICAEDNKAFLNQMSMQYHRYISHELGERKAERKRLRERAAERQARSVAHAAQQQQRQHRARQQEAQLRQQQEATPAPTADDATEAVLADPYLADSTATARATEDPYGTAAEDPYLAETAMGASGADAVAAGANAAAPAAEAAAPAAEARAAASDGRTAATGGAAAAAKTGSHDQRPLSSLPAAGAAAAVAAAPAATAAAPAAVVADEEDLYSDVVGGDGAKRQKSASTYATAIGAILEGDFDEDE